MTEEQENKLLAARIEDLLSLPLCSLLILVALEVTYPDDYPRIFYVDLNLSRLEFLGLTGHSISLVLFTYILLSLGNLTFLEKETKPSLKAIFGGFAGLSMEAVDIVSRHIDSASILVASPEDALASISTAVVLGLLGSKTKTTIQKHLNRHSDKNE